MAIIKERNAKGEIEKVEGGGRIKGARNLLQGEFLSDAVRSWRNGGAAVLEIIKVENPIAYAKIMASVIPKELVIDDARKEEMTDEELVEFIAEYRRIKSRRVGQGGGDGRSDPDPTLN